MVADLHAITTPQNPTEVLQRTVDPAALLLAIGIDPERSVFFLQSRVPQHAQLAWVLNCFTAMGELRRMAQFKDKSLRRGETEATAGLFAYPVLQATDILLYQADRVPIGEDQRQHLELTRTIALRFNARYQETFKIPDPLIAPKAARIMDLREPRKKMSKSTRSSAGLLLLTDPPEVVRSKIAAATTDSGCEIRLSTEKPGISNLITIYSILDGAGLEHPESLFSGMTYADFKTNLAEKLVDFLRPVQQRYVRVKQERAYIDQVLTDGSKRAATVAEETLTAVHERIGFLGN